MFELAWLIPVFPLLTYVLITLVPPIRQSRQLSYGIAIVMMLLATALAWGVLFQGATSANGFGHAESAQAAGHGEGEGEGEAATTEGAATAAEDDHGGGVHFNGFGSYHRGSFVWAPTGTTSFEMGYRLDPVVALMLAMVTLAALCIHIFSIGYMAHDEFPAGHQRQARFFSFISLFTAAMLTMVLADNLLLFFAAWEIMGLCSFLLIGFWYFKQSAREAAKKAFITTRIGDVGMLLGIVYLYNEAGSVTFGTAEGQIFNQAFLDRIAGTQNMLGISVATGIALLLFMGTVGKSAQFPLHVWLPDAMEGPTPVSALIHAATMVAAGVFLVARTYPIFVASEALPIVAGIGAFTALFAALIAVGQYDIKRILAYSTLSQLGFMVAALGVGGWLAGMFHLLTHAFFKALLFLGSGSVIHGMEAAVGHDPVKAQDIRNMGNMKKYMPRTYLTYLIGYLALAGFPFLFSGFWSKDEILLDAFNNNKIVWVMLSAAAFLTAFYMTRQMAVVFWGSNFRGHNPRPVNPPAEPSEKEIHGHDHGAHELGPDSLDLGHAAMEHSAVDAHRHAAHGAHDAHAHDAHDAHAHDAHGHDAHGAHGAGLPHESPPSMLIPLFILAAFAIGAGFLNAGLAGVHWLANFTGQPHAEVNYLVMGLAIGLALAGMFFGWLVYRNAFRTSQDVDPLARALGGVYGALERKFGFDELYQATIIRLNYILGRVARWLDDKVVDRIVNVTGLGTFFLGRVNFIIDDFSLNTSTDTLADGTVMVGDGVRQAQSGKIQDYGAMLFAGAVVVALIYVYAL